MPGNIYIKNIAKITISKKWHYAPKNLQVIPHFWFVLLLDNRRTWPSEELKKMFVNLMLLALQRNKGLLQKIQQAVKILEQI